MHSAFLNRALQGLGVVSAVGVLVACGTLQSNPNTPLKAATGTSLPNCEALSAKLQLPNTRIESAAPVAAGAVMQGDKAVPAHCLVKGRMHERKGSDGRDYAIGFEMRLPVVLDRTLWFAGRCARRPS